MSIKTPEYKSEFLFTKNEMRTRIEKLREKNKALRTQLKAAEEVIRRAWDESECCSCEAVAGSVACCECEHQTFMREYLDYHARYIQPDLPTFEDVKGILGEVE